VQLLKKKHQPFDHHKCQSFIYFQFMIYVYIFVLFINCIVDADFNINVIYNQRIVYKTSGKSYLT